MNWKKIKKWFRRKPKPTHETRRIPIPDDMVAELARLDDAFWAAPGKSRVELYAFWKFLEPIETKALEGLPAGSVWKESVDWSSPTDPVLVVEIEIPPKETSQ